MSDKTIRFVDSEYRELFQIPDGASITITYPSGDDRGTLTRPCQYIDEAHVRVGSNDYHICEFAERMEALGAKYQPSDQLRGAVVVPFAGMRASFSICEAMWARPASPHCPAISEIRATVSMRGCT